MSNKFLKILIHPLFIFLVIAFLECRPYRYNFDTTVYNQLPKIGQNFKAPDDYAVYYYSGNGKYIYSSEKCYFKLGNPPWNTSVEDGGVLTIQASIVKQIPLIGDMCGGEKHNNSKIKKFEKKLKENVYKKYLSFNFLLDSYSGFAHLFSFFILAFSIIYYYRDRKRKYWVAFFGCFFGGAFLELIQHFFIVGRSATSNDQINNTFGAIIGIVLYWIIDRTKLKEKIQNTP